MQVRCGAVMDSGSAALEFLSRWAQQQASRKGAGGVMLPGNGLVSRDEHAD